MVPNHWDSSVGSVNKATMAQNQAAVRRGQMPTPHTVLEVAVASMSHILKECVGVAFTPTEWA